jgi:hypothetical protein
MCSGAGEIVAVMLGKEDIAGVAVKYTRQESD